jgi:hypothetical protein
MTNYNSKLTSSITLSTMLLAYSVYILALTVLHWPSLDSLHPYFVKLAKYYNERWSVLALVLVVTLVGSLIVAGWFFLTVHLQSLVHLDDNPLRVPTNANASYADALLFVVSLVFLLFLGNWFDLTTRFLITGSILEWMKLE